jgi:23S rRNA (adenine2503-C2)-methyltransferase
MKKTCIKNLSHDDVLEFIRSAEEKDSRTRQLFSWIYERNVSSFDEITDFSRSFRKLLSERFFISALECVDRKISSDGSAQKFLFKTLDGHFIESVLLNGNPEKEGWITICVSSQVGCAMGCSFCATARIGFIRNLDTAEILDQISQIRRITNLHNNNTVFMGMGEPFNNYDNVLRAAEIMNYSFGLHLSVRKITISTCGIFPGIKRFFDENRRFNLAISLNDTEPLKRSQSMPVEKVYSMQQIAEFIRSVTPDNHGGKITLEYVMRKDNISSDDAQRLKRMFGGTNFKINLIPLNPIDSSNDHPLQSDIDRFIKDCIKFNLPVNIRKSLGSEISGACGQLSGQRYDMPRFI